MKCVNQNKNKKRLSSVSRSKKPAKTPKNYIIDSKTKENKSNELINENMNESQPKFKTKDSTEIKVSPQIIRTTFDSINVYLENMKAFYLHEVEKLNSNVEKIEQNVNSANNQK